MSADLALIISDSVMVLGEPVVDFVVVSAAALFISLLALSEQKLWDFCKLKGLVEVVLTTALQKLKGLYAINRIIFIVYLICKSYICRN